MASAIKFLGKRIHIRNLETRIRIPETLSRSNREGVWLTPTGLPVRREQSCANEVNTNFNYSKVVAIGSSTSRLAQAPFRELAPPRGRPYTFV
jgi:hypothetical protein